MTSFSADFTVIGHTVGVTDADSTQQLPDAGLLDGRYRLERSLGRGGVAEVFEAFDTKLERRVAVKLFRGDAAEELQRHQAEMRTLAQLDHPSLVTVYDAGQDGERPFLVMQLIEGTTVAAEIARTDPIPSEQVAAWGATVAAGLAYCHGQGVIHRDVKPANLLLGHDGRVYLADFGIARLADTAHVTRAGEVVGTPAYFAPEQVAGEPVGPAADIYALGLVLLECLTGRKAYEGTAWEVAVARLSRDPELPPDLEPAWRSLLAGMLARTAGQRPLATEAATRLRLLAGPDTGGLIVPPPQTVAATQLLSPVTDATTRIPVDPTTATGTTPPRRRGQRAGIIIVIVLLAALVIGGAIALINRANQSASAPWTPGQPTISKAKVEQAVTKLETDVKNAHQ